MRSANRAKKTLSKAKVTAEAQSAFRTPPAHGPSSSRGTRGSRIIWPLLALLIPIASYPQNTPAIQVSNPAVGAVSNNGDVHIDPNSSDEWPMPTLNIFFSYALSCQKVSLDLKMAWGDPYTGYETYYDTGPHAMSATDTWILDQSGWGYPFNGGTNMSEGGYATISYQIDNGPTQYFYINIGGFNPSQTVADNFYTSLAPPITPTPPWFWGNILSQESTGEGWGARQYYVTGCPIPSPEYVNNCPLVTPTPDGIGISQVDGTSNPNSVNDFLYWNYESNIETGLEILYNAQSAAYGHWKTQVDNMHAYSGGTDITAPSTGCNNLGTYTAFAFPEWIGRLIYEDAEWMNAYNGLPQGYFIDWNTTSGDWQINYPYTNSKGITFDYVHQACAKTPF